MKSTHFIVAILFYIITNSCVAQNYFGIYSVTQLTQDDGLSQGSNYFRFEDSKGFMWITAADAVNRYDGSSVKVYNLNRYFKNCPNLQQGYGFTEDDDANIYIGSDKGLYIYTRNTDKFTLQKIFTVPDQIAMPFAFANNKVWCFNRYYQLATYNVKTKEIKIEANTNVDTLSGIHIYQNIENVFFYRFPTMDMYGNIWMVGKHTIGVYNTINKITTYPAQKILKNKPNIFFCSAFDTNNNILNIGTNNGILQFYATTNTYKTIDVIYNRKLGLINQIAISNNVIAFNSASNNASIGIINNDGKKAQWLKLNENKNTRALNQFAFDKSGRLWTMDDAKGQKIFCFKQKLFNKMPDENTMLPIIHGAAVSTMAELPNKDMLFQSYWAINKMNNSLYIKEGANFYNQFYFSVTDTLRKGVWHFNPSIYTNKKIEQPQIFFRDSNDVFKRFANLSLHANIRQIQDLAALASGKILVSDATGLFWFDEKIESLTVANSTSNSFKINVLSNNRIAVSYLNKDMLLYQLNNKAALTEL